MIKEYYFKNGCLVVEYRLTDEETEILRLLKTDEYVKFVYLNENTLGTMDKKHIVDRESFKDLLKHKFIKKNRETLHYVCILTDLGKMYLELELKEVVGVI